MPAACQPAGFPRRIFLTLRFILLFTFLLTELKGHSQNAYKPDFSYLRLNEINASAARHFLIHFTSAGDVKWTSDDKYFIANFTEGHTRGKAYYKSNGNFAFCFKYYQADALEEGLKSAIIRKFPDSKIIVVTEINTLEAKAYYINISDGGAIKTLLCNEEGIKITETIQNAGA